MKKYGIFKDGEILEKFDSIDECVIRHRELSKEDSSIRFRRILFSDLTEDEKLQMVEERLNGLSRFLRDMEGSGRSYYSHTNIEHDELKWLVEHAKKNFE